MLDSLPDELIFHIFAYLDIQDVVRVQLVSSRLLRLARDRPLWKRLCFDDSRAEAARRRQRLYELQDARLADLREAINAFPPHLGPTVDIDGIQQDLHRLRAAAREPERLHWSRALANWDPAYPRETIDYYEEYVQRHAKISLDWKVLPTTGSNDKDDIREATGLAIFHESACRASSYAVSPLDDGSIVMYNLARMSTTEVAGHSGPGLLTPGLRSQITRHAMMTETSSVEVVSIDSQRNRGFFAVGTLLHEVDLRQLSLMSSKQYPFPITALSDCSTMSPLVVGTNNTVHIYDSRDNAQAASPTSMTRTELIAGPIPGTLGHITLAQPGPLSLLHAGRNDSIFVAGRFTSLLQYSLRHFPRLERTIHSGARISCMTCLPYPYLSQQYDLTKNHDLTISQYTARRAVPGWTAICAGEYKGKGSLELYSMSADSYSHNGDKYLNRQTAGRSKLLSVASHGGKIVHTDGDGNIRWSERDGVTAVRTFNINECGSEQAATSDSTIHGLWTNSREGHGEADIVQKLLPYQIEALATGHTAERLLLWSGDGRLGMLAFGPQGSSSADKFHDALEVQVESAAEHARQDAERQYAMTMRRALERSADEVRFVRGLGMAG